MALDYGEPLKDMESLLLSQFLQNNVVGNVEILKALALAKASAPMPHLFLIKIHSYHMDLPIYELDLTWLSSKVFIITITRLAHVTDEKNWTCCMF